MYFHVIFVFTICSWSTFACIGDLTVKLDDNKRNLRVVSRVLDGGLNVAGIIGYLDVFDNFLSCKYIFVMNDIHSINNWGYNIF